MAKKRVKHTGKTYPKVDWRDVAKGLGASAVEPLAAKGLEVIFNEPLRKADSLKLGCEGLSPGGAIFPFECLEGFDIDKGIVILADDYQAWQDLDSGMIILRSAAPNRPLFSIRKDKVVSIRILPSGRFLYPTS